MRTEWFRATSRTVAFSLLLAGVVPAAPPQDGDDGATRGSFLLSRDEVPAPPPPTRRKRPTTPAARPKPVGLGYTVFMAGANGQAARVDPSKVFHGGDRLRFVLESSVDGYLYVFTTENGHDPVMLLPDPDLDRGANFVHAHVPFEFPSSRAASEDLRWLDIAGPASTDSMLFLISRKPIPGIPTGADLVSYCKTYASECPWRPSDAVWRAVSGEAASPVLYAKATTYGSAISTSERDAIQRRVRLRRDDPEPSIIKVASETAGAVATRVDLAHEE